MNHTYMPVVYCGLFLIGVIGFLILWGEGLFKTKTALFLSAALLVIAMALRGFLLPHETLDYQDFLRGWVQFYRYNGGWRALGASVGNYNVPYLYFLALFSYLPVPDLYLIKLLSILFDVLLAWAVLRLVRCFSKTFVARLSGFFLTLLLPTVVLNGAYWGQCDSIYGALAVWSLALALENKPFRAVIAIALSFAFKLQAVFLMPVFLIFLFTGRMKWYHLLAFPVTYLLVVLPAVLAGRPLADTLLLYFSQAGSVGSGLNYNSPSVFALLPTAGRETLWARAGIAAAFGALLLLYIFCWTQRRRLGDRSLLVCALLITVTVPFLLPHMHDRYFFLADVLSLALAVAFPPLVHVPLCVSFASLLGYHAYLRMRYLLPMRYGAYALLLVVLTLCFYLPVTRTGSKNYKT